MRSDDGEPVALVVDDDSVLRIALSAVLVEAGFQPELAPDGDQAIAAFDELQPSLVILDVIMPGMDGFEVCEKLRARPGGEFVPILMMTGCDDTESIERAYDLGATDFLTKPVNFALLKRRLRYIVRATETLKELRESELHLDSAQRMARLGSWDWEMHRDTIRLSSAAFGILGLDPARRYSHYEDLFVSVHEDDRERVVARFEQSIKERCALKVEHRIVSPGGSVRVVQQEALFAREANAGPKLIGTVLDVTERKEAERKIVDLAYYDGLTRLPNRTFLMEHLNFVLTQHSRNDRLGAILSLDLDRFKQVNDAFGHSAGDSLLRAVAGRLLKSLRSSDCVVRRNPDAGSIHGPTRNPSRGDITVARFGGDEFTILLSEIRKPEDSGLVASRILDLFSEPFDLEGKEVFVTPSIGIALYPKNGVDAETLLEHADAAMYLAKEHGSAYRYYSESINSKARERLLLGSRLRTAIQTNALTLAYQPKLDVKTGDLIGLEALARWTDSELGSVSPAKFIPVSEETGLVVPLGMWAIRTVCAQMATWKRSGVRVVPVAVNVSARQLRGEGLIRTIERALEENGLSPHYLEIEITEGVLIEDAKGSLDILNRLKAMGIRISLDDFGTGYSSLSYLKRFLIDTVKIDQSFVRDVTTNPDSAAIVHAIIALSDSLKLNVVAEGVETEEHLSFLREHGCRQAQGYFFSRPLAVEELEVWLQDAMQTV